MKRRSVTAVALLFGFVHVSMLATSVYGQRQRAWSQWTSVGPTCQSFIRSTGTERDTLVTFTLGLIAGTNKERDGVRQVWFTPEETERKVEMYCKVYPDDPMASAGFSIVDGR